MTAGDPRMRITIPNDPTKGDSLEKIMVIFLKDSRSIGTV
jgi:hypothetical protein